MSGFGIVRRMDELGRIVIPKELRRIMRLKEGDEMEIFSEGESLVVRKHSRFDAVRRAADKAVRLLHERTGCDVFLIAADKVAAAAVRTERNSRRGGSRRSAPPSRRRGKHASCPRWAFPPKTGYGSPGQ